jgi:hypothetical protein
MAVTVSILNSGANSFLLEINMSGHFYLLWAMAHQQISHKQWRGMSEDEFYEKYDGSPSRLGFFLRRFFELVYSLFVRNNRS